MSRVHHELGAGHVFQQRGGPHAVVHLLQKSAGETAVEALQAIVAPQVDVLPPAGVGPDDVHGAGTVHICHADLSVLTGVDVRRVVYNVTRREGVVSPVEPDVHLVKANLHQVGQAIAVDVGYLNALVVRVGEPGRAGHDDLGAVDILAGTAVDRGVAPLSVASIGPISDVAALEIDEVLQTVAVHVAELEVAVVKLHHGPAHENTGVDGLVGNRVAAGVELTELSEHKLTRIGWISRAR